MQVPGDHVTVAAVIALAADHEDRSGAQMIEAAAQRIGDGAAGVFHQDDARDADLLDGPAINLPHLLGGQKLHQRSRMTVATPYWPS